MSERPWQDEDTLRELYHERKMSTPQMAESFGCSDTTVRNHMKRFGIDVRPQSERTTLAGLERHPQIAVASNGYEYITNKHRGEKFDVLHHRLIAVAEYGFDEVAENHVHHAIPIPWLNYRDNLEVMPEAGHKSHHHKKLSWLDELRVCEMYRNGDCPQRVVGDQFDVSGAVVSKTINHGGDSMLGKVTQ